MAPNHLSDDQLLNAAYGVADAAEERHLGECVHCEESMRRLAARLGLHGAAPAYWADDLSTGRLDSPPEAFWQRQRAVVLERISLPEVRPAFRPKFAFVATLLALVLGGVLLAPRGHLLRLGPEPVGRKAPAPTSDEQLFRAAFTAANQIEPRALEPVMLVLPAARTQLAEPIQPEAATFTISAGDRGAVFAVNVTEETQVSRQRRN